MVFSEDFFRNTVRRSVRKTAYWISLNFLADSEKSSLSASIDRQSRVRPRPLRLIGARGWPNDCESQAGRSRSILLRPRSFLKGDRRQQTPSVPRSAPAVQRRTHVGFFVEQSPDR